MSSILAFLFPLEGAHPGNHTLAAAFLGQLRNMAHSAVWFLLVGFIIYALSLRSRVQRFSYALPIEEPGDKFSLSGGLKFLLPRSFYTHRSVWIDWLSLPFTIVIAFLGFLGLTLGTAAVQGWLLHELGHSPLHFPAGVPGTVLEVVILLLARDFGRFLWHYQGHSVPFFWEFHKGHHSAEVLHPFGVRTHPVDMFIRNTYTGVGGALIAGSLIYLLGMEVTATVLSWVAIFLAVSAVFELFEHTHVRLSFGNTLGRIFYAPYMHHFHHGAAAEHMNVNLGITGGLVLWDHLFGTLYWPKPGEKVVWGASLEELGERNPHRTLWGFFVGPFVAAAQTLRSKPRDTQSSQ
jgi:sterol desaturase/sphingolipid hydroxylase (fatty acid hydroxylase superfamily)